MVWLLDDIYINSGLEDESREFVDNFYFQIQCFECSEYIQLIFNNVNDDREFIFLCFYRIYFGKFQFYFQRVFVLHLVFYRDK